MIPVALARNERPDVCGPCGGACCKRGPGTALPEDFGRTPRERLEGLREAILTRRYIIVALTPALHRVVHHEGAFAGFVKETYPRRLLYVRPRAVDEEGLFSTKHEGTCSLLTPSGCGLAWEARPSGCRALVPNEEKPGACGYSPSLPVREWGAFTREYEAAQAWRSRWRFLHRLLRELGQEPLRDPPGGTLKRSPVIEQRANNRASPLV